jgi:hypothetical protein
MSEATRVPRANSASAKQTKDPRSWNEQRAYYRLLRYLLSEGLEMSYKEGQARPLPPRLRELVKKIEYRKPSQTR